VGFGAAGARGESDGEPDEEPKRGQQRQAHGDAPGLLVQLDGHIGDGRRRPATVQMHLTSEARVTGPNPVAPTRTRSEAIFGILPKSQAVNRELRTPRNSVPVCVLKEHVRFLVVRHVRGGGLDDPRPSKGAA
jgi:hypothetical protein